MGVLPLPLLLLSLLLLLIAVIVVRRREYVVIVVLLKEKLRDTRGVPGAGRRGRRTARDLGAKQSNFPPPGGKAAGATGFWCKTWGFPTRLPYLRK